MPELFTTIVRHEWPDRMVSVYRGRVHHGLVLPVLSGGGFDALPSAPLWPRVPNRRFLSESTAIAYLAEATS